VKVSEGDFGEYNSGRERPFWINLVPMDRGESELLDSQFSYFVIHE